MEFERVSDTQKVDASAKASIDHDAPLTRVLAGVSVPDSPLITAVIEHAERLSEPFLFNHAMRSWLFAETIGRVKEIDYDHEVVAIGTILHDIGLTAGGSNSVPAAMTAPTFGQPPATRLLLDRPARPGQWRAMPTASLAFMATAAL